MTPHLDGPMRPTPTETEAYTRADEHIAEAIAALGVPVRLEPGIRNAIGYDAGELGPGDHLNVEVSSTLEDLPDDEIPAARNERYFAALKRFWAERGYRPMSTVPSEDGADEPGAHPDWFRAVHVRHPADGCVVSLKQGRLGNLWITASMVAVAEGVSRET